MKPYWRLLRRSENNHCNQSVSRANLWFELPSSIVFQTTTNQIVVHILSLYPYRTRDSLLGKTVTGQGGWFVIFRLFNSILFFVNWISLYFFPYLVKEYIFMYINIVFWLGRDRLSGFLSFEPPVLFSIITLLLFPSSSASLSYLMLAVPMRKCLEKHSCMSSLFPIAILNGTSFFSLWCKRN